MSNEATKKDEPIMKPHDEKPSKAGGDKKEKQNKDDEG